MRLLIFLLILGFFTTKLFSQPPINITDGYIGKPIYALDSGYLFARSLANDELFYRWDLRSASKIEILDAEFESTLWFRMTPFPTIAKANFRYLQKPITLQNFDVQGANVSRKVFFAKADNPKGTVFLFHTEATSAVEWTLSYYEQFQLLKALQYYGYSVVLFDCEERALSTDANDDKVINWHIEPHSISGNDDYKNCELVLAELKKRNLVEENENIYAIGNSNGGQFAQGFAELFSAKACVMYNAMPNPQISSTLQKTPILFHVSVNDVSVNSSINQLYVDSLRTQSKCGNIHYTRPTPLYPEVFARSRMIPMELSIKLFEELKENQYLTNFHYLNKSYSELFADIINNPSKWPEARFLNSSFSTAYNRQLKISSAEKEFNSNRVSSTVEFLEFPCEVNTSVAQKEIEQTSIRNFETSINGTVTIALTRDSHQEIKIYSITGEKVEVTQKVIHQNAIEFSFLNIPKGLYFFKDSNGSTYSILNTFK